ncbi:MAG: ROK family protein [Oscillospiraceae bacterium]|nr:ROK family protein [Oscillospiraceae bacterium]
MAKYYIGIDLGGTNIAAGIVNENGEILFRKSVKTNLPQPEYVIENKICDLCRDICQENGFVLGRDITSIGVGTPGNVNSETGVVGFNVNFGYIDWHLKEKVEKQIPGVEVFIENDANSAIIAEVIAGCAKGCEHAVILTLGTGVGAGVIVDGKVLNGYNQSAAEIGHMVISAGGRQCNCGRKGCFERYCSATALISDTKEAMLKNPDSKLWKVCPDIEHVNAKTVFDADELGDETAKQVIDSYIEYLACGITNVVNIFQPEVVCLGGGVSNQKEGLLRPIQEYLDKEDYARHLMKRVTLKIATFRNDAGIIGAAMLGVYNA